MAILDVNYYSPSLLRQVTFKAIIPTEQLENHPEGLPTLYLLHGYMGDYTNWLNHTKVAKVAAKFNMAVIMPSGENKFYIDHEQSRSFYGKFIGEELVQETRKLFPLSKQREDTFIGGLSMGGYGAIRNGLKYNETFGAIVGFSSALIQEQVLNSTNDASTLLNNRSYLETIFGDLNKLKGSDKDVEALVRRLVESKSVIPSIYFTCGSEDFLIEDNRKFHHFLKELGIEHTYFESPGNHDWVFWDHAIEPAMRYLHLLNK